MVIPPSALRIKGTRRISRNLLFLPVACLLLPGLTGCAWVKVSEEGAQVAIVPAGRVQDCHKVGRAATSVKDSVLGISRNRDKVLTELDALARQEAVDMGANTLVRESAADGSASYLVYRCP